MKPAWAVDNADGMLWWMPSQWQLKTLHGGMMHG